MAAVRTFAQWLRPAMSPNADVHTAKGSSWPITSARVCQSPPDAMPLSSHAAMAIAYRNGTCAMEVATVRTTATRRRTIAHCTNASRPSFDAAMDVAYPCPSGATK